MFSKRYNAQERMNGRYIYIYIFIYLFMKPQPHITQSDQKAIVDLMNTIQEITWLNLTAWQPTAKVRARGTLDSH
jgi:hypothetical protein